MQNMTTKKVYTFKCNRWLAVDEDDFEIVREIPVEAKKMDKGLVWRGDRGKEGRGGERRVERGREGNGKYVENV